jgi:hypothetical protein
MFNVFPRLVSIGEHIPQPLLVLAAPSPAHIQDDQPSKNQLADPGPRIAGEKSASRRHKYQYQ